MIPVNSIRIPEQFVVVGSRWWRGTDDMLYALAKHNDLIIGTATTPCPEMAYTDKNDRNRKWYLTIWRKLLDDMASAIDAIMTHCRSYERQFDTDSIGYRLGCEDLQVMCQFADWAVEQVRALEDSYNLKDWRI